MKHITEIDVYVHLPKVSLFLSDNKLFIILTTGRIDIDDYLSFNFKNNIKLVYIIISFNFK